MKTVRPDVLILTAHEDSTADFLIPYLDRAGLSWYRWDPGTLTRLSRAGVHFNKRRWCSFEVIDEPATRILLDEVGVIWLRRPTPIFCSVALPNSGMRQFVDDEVISFLRGMWSTVPVPWVNDPEAGRLASYKPLQLSLAAKLGFSVPRTYIGNEPSQVAVLFNKCHGRIVVKSFERPFVQVDTESHRMLYTTPVSREDIAEVDAIRACPSIWQEYVQKKLELRITVVANNVIAAEIHSQNSELTKHDWRNYDMKNVPHRPHKLPRTITRMCLDLTERLDLSYAAVDMILTPKGEYVFLEVNPFGQWAWIEQVCGLPIAAAHCKLFQKLAKARHRRPQRSEKSKLQTLRKFSGRKFNAKNGDS